MSLLTIALIILGLLFVQGIGLYLTLRRREDTPREDNVTPLLMQRLEGLERTLDSRMSDSAKQMHETMRTQLGESARMQELLKDLTADITSVKEIGRESGK